MEFVAVDFDYMSSWCCVHCTDDDSFSELDASSLDFLQNLDMQVNSSLSDSELACISGESQLCCSYDLCHHLSFV